MQSMSELSLQEIEMVSGGSNSVTGIVKRLEQEDDAYELAYTHPVDGS